MAGAPIGNKYADGLYNVFDLNEIDEDFSKESELTDFVEKNIKSLVFELYKEDVISYKREYPINTLPKMRSRRVDFLIKGDKSTIVLECKAPRYTSEISKAVGQCLTYLTVSSWNNPIDRICIVSSKIDPLLPEIIDRYKLPIDFAVVNKKHLLKWLS